MITAAIMLAASTQAASITWGGWVGNYTLDPANGYCQGTVNAYLIYTTAVGGFTPVGSGANTWGNFDTATYTTAAGGTMVASTTLTATESGVNAAFDRSYTRTFTEINAYYMVVITDSASPNNFGAFTAQVSGVGDDFSAPSLVLLQTGWNAGEYLEATAFTSVVPEPTSMALFALGAAVLGLRRRFKK
jgi:hypothetical protein